MTCGRDHESLQPSDRAVQNVPAAPAGGGPVEPAPRDEPSARVGRRLHIGLLVLATVITFLNSLHNAYHLDDFARIANNPEINRFWPPWRHFVDPATGSVNPLLAAYRPLLPLTLSVDRALARMLGVDPLVVHHVGNVAIHATSAVLVYLVFLELLNAWAKDISRRRSATLAFAGALLFAIHPVSGVPVNYLAARDLLLMLLFLLASLLYYVKLRRARAGWTRYWLPLALLILSVLSKTDAVAAPLLVAWFELVVGGARLSDRELWCRVGATVAVVGGFFVFTKGALGFWDAEQVLVQRRWFEYPLVQLELHVGYYLRNFLWPFHMRQLPEISPLVRPLDPWVAVGGALVVSSLVLAWRLRRRWPVASFSIGAYWVLMSPTSSVFSLRMLAADYRQYPSLPWACLLMVLAAQAMLAQRTANVALGMSVAYLAVSTLVMNRTWRDEESLWRQSVRRGGNAMAHNNYGLAVEGSDPALAEREFTESLRLGPDDPRANINLGLLLIRHDRAKEGLPYVRRAAELAPRWGMTHYWLSRALSMLKQPAEAAAESAKAAELEPRNPLYTYQAAEDAQTIGKFADCLRYLATLGAVAEDYELSGFYEGWSLQALGRREEAVAVYRKFLPHRPDFAQAHFNLAFALMELGRCNEAIPEFERTLQLRPDYHEVHLHLSRCHRETGSPALAAEHAKKYDERPR